MPQSVTYRFFTSEKERIVVDLKFDDATFQLLVPAGSPTPEWTKLAYERCPNCSLPDETKSCPAAVGLAMFLPSFQDKPSFDKAVVEVETPNRGIVSKTTLQAGVASLVGLVCATSGCPHSRFLRPMARFHLPFADERETVFRSLGAHLLGLFITAKLSGRQPDFSLDDFKDNYARLSVVNGALAERLRNAVTRDAALNAVVILDSFAQIAPENIDGGFEDILHCFAVEAG
jgi:hypothetical protein